MFESVDVFDGNGFMLTRIATESDNGNDSDQSTWAIVLGM